MANVMLTPGPTSKTTLVVVFLHRGGHGWSSAPGGGGLASHQNPNKNYHTQLLKCFAWGSKYKVYYLDVIQNRAVAAMEEVFQELSPKLRVLLSLSSGVNDFSKIIKETGLSRATVNKWLKIMQVMGLVEKRGHNNYSLTNQGNEYLRNIFTELVRKAFSLGLVREVKLYTIVQDIERDDEGLNIILNAYPDVERQPARVVINISNVDDLDIEQEEA